MIELELAATIPWKKLVSVKAAKSWAVDAPIADLERAITDAKDSYYNSEEALVSDNVYDVLEDTLKKRKPKSQALIVGAPVLEKVKLPVHLGSQDKVKTAEQLERWLARNPAPSYVVTDKLDGISALYMGTKANDKLFTRGDGSYGKDISAFIRHFKLSSLPAGTMARGELIMSESAFNKVWATHFSNARAAVSGVTNRKDIHKALASIDAIFYELVDGGTPEQQLKALKAAKLKVVPYKVFKTLDFNGLVDYYNERKKSSDHAIDGLVVVANVKARRNTSGNPTNSMAFKVNNIEDAPTAEVVKVHWAESRHGKLKPRIEIKPIPLQGVTVKFATAFNAQYIQDNKIGPGTKIRIVRSGEVIPYITEVVKGTKAQMPSVAYSWSGVDIVADESTDVMYIKQAEHFFTYLGVEGFKFASIKSMFDAGYDLFSLLEAGPDDYEEVLGRNGIKIESAVTELINTAHSLDDLMAASNIFEGMGKRFTQLIETIPDVMTAPKSSVVERLSLVPGWGPSSQHEFIAKFPQFKKFLNKTGLDYFVPKPKRKPTKGKLLGQVVLFTGFRDKDLADAIEKNGGTLASGFNKNTTVVLAPTGTSNNKTEAAKAAGIKPMDAETFRRKFNI